MTRTLNTAKGRFEADPIPRAKAPQQVRTIPKRHPNLHEVQSQLRVATAKLTAIASCTNIKQVKSIIS